MSDTNQTQAAANAGGGTQTQAGAEPAKAQATQAQPEGQQQAAPKADTTGLDAIKKELAISREQTAKLQDKLNIVERQQAEKGGDLKKVLKLEQESKAKLQAEFDQLKQSLVTNKVRSAVAEKAKDAHNVDHLLQLGDDKKITVVEGTVYGVDEFVSELRKNSPHLFKVQDVNAGPKVGPTGPPPKVDEKYYEELGKQRTAAGVAAVRKKYGVDSGADMTMIDGRLQ